MTVAEVLNELLYVRRWTQTKLADEMGKTRSDVNGYLRKSKGSMKMSTFIELANTMGFEVIVRDKMGTKQEFPVELDGGKGVK